VTDRHGKLVGVVGKELRDARSNIWLNYAVPVGEMTEAIGDILAGKVRPAATDDQPEPAADPLTLRLLGVALVPDVLPKTPPYVERVEPDSPAAAAGLRPDDLVTFLDDRMINSCKELIEGLSQIDRQQPIKLLVLRDVELIELTLKAQP